MKLPNPSQINLEFLFDTRVPQAPAAEAGALKLHLDLCQVIADALKASPLSREDIGDRMSSLTGEHITKHMLDAWSAKSRDLMERKTFIFHDGSTAGRNQANHIAQCLRDSGEAVRDLGIHTSPRHIPLRANSSPTRFGTSTTWPRALSRHPA